MKILPPIRKRLQSHSDISPVAVHASYLINIASPDEALWEKSYQALKVEVERCGALDIPLITFHPGSYMKSNEETGLTNISRALKRLLEETAATAPGYDCLPGDNGRSRDKSWFSL